MPFINDWGQDTTRDSFWLLKLKEGALYDSSTMDDSAEARVGVQSGVPAADLHELLRRFRAVGADPLAQPEAQVYCGGALRQPLICKYVPNYYKEH